MIKKITKLTLSALGITALASACTMEAAMEAPQEEVATSEEALVCTNHQAIHSVMAALASAASSELGRWAPQVANKPGDIFFNYSAWRVQLTQAGKDCCAVWPSASAPKNCKWLYATLELQEDFNNGVIIGGQKLDSGLLVHRLEAAFKRQEVCMNRPDNGQADNCPAEKHDLKFISASNPSTSCATVVKYDAFKAVTAGPPAVTLFSQSLATADAAQLANMLLWAGWDLPGVADRNPWIAFKNSGKTVEIDPLPGMAEGVPTAQSGDQYLVSYHYQGGQGQVPQWGYVESMNGLSLRNLPCKADPEFCTHASTCPTSTIRYLAKRPMSATKWDCKLETKALPL